METTIEQLLEERMNFHLEEACRCEVALAALRGETVANKNIVKTSGTTQNQPKQGATSRKGKRPYRWQTLVEQAVERMRRLPHSTTAMVWYELLEMKPELKNVDGKVRASAMGCIATHLRNLTAEHKLKVTNGPVVKGQQATYAFTTPTLQ